MDVRQIEWEAFCSTITEHYRTEGCELEMKFGIDGKDVGKFVIRDKEGGVSRELALWDAYEEIGKILFPKEPVTVFSIYKPKEGWLGKEFVYIAVKAQEGQSG